MSTASVLYPGGSVVWVVSCFFFFCQLHQEQIQVVYNVMRDEGMETNQDCTILWYKKIAILVQNEQTFKVSALKFKS